jgi:hypothetical protein
MYPLSTNIESTVMYRRLFAVLDHYLCRTKLNADSTSALLRRHSITMTRRLIAQPDASTQVLYLHCSDNTMEDTTIASTPIPKSASISRQAPRPRHTLSHLSISYCCNTRLPSCSPQFVPTSVVVVVVVVDSTPSRI